MANGMGCELVPGAPEIVERVRSHLRENGAVRLIEFENKQRLPGGWWNWKDEKNVLEAMLLTGEVMIARRRSCLSQNSKVGNAGQVLKVTFPALWRPAEGENRLGWITQTAGVRLRIKPVWPARPGGSHAYRRIQLYPGGDWRGPAFGIKGT